MSVNIQVPTLSQRKAARRPVMDAPIASPAPAPEAQETILAQAPALASPDSTPAIATEASTCSEPKAPAFEPKPEVKTAPKAEPSWSAPISNPAFKAQPTPAHSSVFIPEPATALNLNLSREALAEIARQMGLSLTPQRKEYIKHSYSVTSEAKATFSSYCDVLGFKMQEALDEAFTDFFAKYREQYERVKNAKTRG